MNKIKYFALSSTLAFLPMMAAAQDATYELDSSGNLEGFLSSILDFINGVLIPFILGVAFLLFVWGMFQYFIAGGANEEAKEKGKSLLIYAILGFVIIIVFWGVINLLSSATGLDGGDADFDISGPSIGGTE
jgi:hypothetical protein